MADYDESVLQEYADSLYRQAQWIAFWSAVDYALKTFVFALILVFVGRAVKAQVFVGAESDILAGLTVIGICFGIRVGRRKAFSLKLEAQKLLCQRQTELNTRNRVAVTGIGGDDAHLKLLEELHKQGRLSDAEFTSAKGSGL